MFVFSYNINNNKSFILWSERNRSTLFDIIIIIHFLSLFFSNPNQTWFIIKKIINQILIYWSNIIYFYMNQQYLYFKKSQKKKYETNNNNNNSSRLSFFFCQKYKLIIFRLAYLYKTIYIFSSKHIINNKNLYIVRVIIKEPWIFMRFEKKNYIIKKRTRRERELAAEISYSSLYV